VPGRKIRGAKQKLPPFWRRVSRSEAERNRELREGEAIDSIERVNTGRRGIWPCFRTPLNTIEERLGVNITGLVRALIEKNMPLFIEKRGGKSPVKILDLGCGSGAALAQLKWAFGTGVKTTGIVEERTPNEVYSGVGRLLVGNMLRLQPGEKYEVIFSHKGAVYHTPLQATAVERVIGWLKLGGTAALEMKHVFTEGNPVVQEVLTVLAQNGIKDWKYIGNMLVFRKPVPRIP